jgi:hypothetical protein
MIVFREFVYRIFYVFSCDHVLRVCILQLYHDWVNLKKFAS